MTEALLNAVKEQANESGGVHVQHMWVPCDNNVKETPSHILIRVMALRTVPEMNCSDSTAVICSDCTAVADGMQ
jgi:hypothetical protein